MHSPGPKVLLTIAGLHPETGGLSRSIPALCDALAAQGAQVELLSLDHGKKFGRPLAPASARATFVDGTTPLAALLRWRPQFHAVLRERCRAGGIQIVHDHSLWLLTSHSASAVARELGLPFVASPRGTLAAWALRHRGWKKKLAWLLYQRRDLQSARVLHATSDAEVRDFRAAGLTQPVALIPNGVEQPAWQEPPPREGPRTLLFLGRLHPIKGLPDLVRAWALVRPPGWRAVIAGGDEGGHRAELEALTRELGVAADFSFPGAVEGAAKWDLYRQADVFVLPSHTENFGLVVAEALACGVPVIAARGAPWEDLVTHRCGWWVANGPEPLAAALREAVAATDEQRREMGRRGRRLVETKYAWPGMAARMLGVYQWMLGHGPRPECLVAL